MPNPSENNRHFIIAGVLVVVSTIVLNLLLQSVLPMPVEASAQASVIDQLFNWHILLISFLFSLVVVFMVYAIIVFRRREGEEGDGAHFEGNTRLEIFWTAAPMIFVVIFGYLGVVTLGDVTRPHPDEITIGVNGFQWGWSFEYEGDIISPELVVPLDHPVRMEMTAQDVLHSFWVPEFRVKQDLVPNQVTEVRFTPTIEGEYRLRCAELCGLSHYSMLADVRVVPMEEYEAWLAAGGVSPAAEEPADAGGEATDEAEEADAEEADAEEADAEEADAESEEAEPADAETTD